MDVNACTLCVVRLEGVQQRAPPQVSALRIAVSIVTIKNQVEHVIKYSYYYRV